MERWKWVAIAGGVLVAVPVIAYLTEKNAQAAGLGGWRGAMLKEADRQVQLHTPYMWGGGHPGIVSWGLDCSGLVIQCAKVAGFVLEWNSGSMWQLCPHVQVPQPADVALFGYNNKAVHVTLVEQWFPAEGRAACIGSQGGDASTTSPEIAAEQNAYVRRSPDHRKDTRFLGFCSLADIAEGRRSGKVLAGFGRFG